MDGSLVVYDKEKDDAAFLPEENGTQTNGHFEQSNGNGELNPSVKLHVDKSVRSKNQKFNLPLLQLVIMESSVNSNQHSGSVSIIFDMTGGSIAVVARGSTGCSIVCSLSSSDGEELDRSLVEFCVSALWRAG